MLPWMDAHSALHIHTQAVERVNRHGYLQADRDEEVRRQKRERAAAQPNRRTRGGVLLQGLRRLRLA
jgi:hypothetical protein